MCVWSALRQYCAIGMFGLVGLIQPVSVAIAKDGATPPTSSLGSQLTNLVARITGAGEIAKKKDPRTRFIVSLARPRPFQVFALTNPNRVIIDMPAVSMRLPPQPAKPIGVVTSFRGGRSGDKRSRVIIDVAEPVVVDNAVIRPNGPSGGTELVIDILPVRSRAALARAKARANVRAGAMSLGAGPARVQPPLPRAAETPELLKKKSFKPLIVLDPGHGGHDSGAKKHGILEKNVVLAFGLRLRERLQRTGRYRVEMTRDTDRFIPLGVRRSFAEKRSAALFISIHADYARSSARGATIYSLRERVASRLKKSARREVGRTVLSADEKDAIQKAAANVKLIRNILSDLAKREVEVTRNRTSFFSDTVVKHMSVSTKMRSDPDREAAFKVLRTAKVPAVLIELAYVSNRRDARKLKSEAWRDKVAASIVEAIDRYFSNTLARLPI
ncbi:MAG: N-acetylmuramoyl-L-alanine amidase [Pseudomonadota bacterium]